jgi:phage shock protein A
MNDLLKKLNTLVQAGIHDLIGDERAAPSSGRRLRPAQLGKDIDGEIGFLRKRINEALDFEDQLKARVQTLEAEVQKWDEQADAAVASGDDATARYAIDQMTRAQQRVSMAESDLREHQLVTQELILRVNTLDAAVADARRAQANEPTADSPTQEPQAEHSSGQALADVLRGVRENITRTGEALAAKVEQTTLAQPETPADRQKIDDDLEARRARLSKPKS